MQEIRSFYVKEGHRVWAILDYNIKMKEFALHIIKVPDINQAPLMLYAYASEGFWDLNTEMSLKWVQQRIIPSNRKNIGMILKAAGLEEYSEFGMLLYHRGTCVQDDLYIEEIWEV